MFTQCMVRRCSVLLSAGDFTQIPCQAGDECNGDVTSIDGTNLGSEKFAHSSQKFSEGANRVGKNEQEHTDDAQNHFPDGLESFYAHESNLRITQIVPANWF